jgi:biopolymer transport protein ExbD
MSRHKKYLAADEPDPSLDISSLIDVCFLLLIYFIVATTIQKSEVDIVHNLPTHSSIDSAGSVTRQQLLDTDPELRSLPLLQDVLKLYASGAIMADKIPLVQLWVDDEANQQRVIDVLNALVGEKIHSVAIIDVAS